MMISPKELVKQLARIGITRYTGVPDSLLKSFCNYIVTKSSLCDNTTAANEGGAIATATGHFLATGQPSVVYFQNSGLGNALNPLISMAHPNVYGIPVILLIGWRGEPGTKDEPQHMEQGKITTKILDALSIPWFILPLEENTLPKFLDQVHNTMNAVGGPVAILVKKGTFDETTPIPINIQENNFNRERAISTLLELLPEKSAVICTTGMASRELYEYRMTNFGKINRDFLMVGAMGHASSVAHAVAKVKADMAIFCLDGDGAFLMHMGAAAVIGKSATSNFTHILLNNGAHDSVGGQPVAAEDLDMVALASACGYRKGIKIDNENDLRDYFTNQCFDEGPIFIELKISKGFRENLGRPKTSPKHNKEQIMEYLRNG